MYKKSSLVTPELISGVAVKFQNNLRGHTSFICYKIRSKNGPRILTLELFEVLYKNKRAAQNINWKNCTRWERILIHFCRRLWSSKWDICDDVIVMIVMSASILRYHFEKKKTKYSVHKKSSLVTPELISGVVFQFQNNLRGQDLFICYKIWSKTGLRILTLDVFGVLYTNQTSIALH